MRTDKQSNAGQSIFMDSMNGVANTGAAVASFFVTGPIYSATIGWVTAYTQSQYGYGWDDLVSFAWFILVAFLSFFVARASLGTLLIMGGMALATRFL